jgi:two-component system, OmpR family, response regulator
VVAFRLAARSREAGTSPSVASGPPEAAEAGHAPVAPRVLIIEGETATAEQLAGLLCINGFGVEITSSGLVGYERALVHEMDAIVLDVELSDLDGLELIRHFRRVRIPTPLIVRSTRDSVSAKLKALDLGADDYVAKSVAQEEVVARISNLIRRAPVKPEEVLRFADVVLDDRSHSVHRAGALLHLSPTLYYLLRCFMLNPGQPLSKETLLLTVWGRTEPLDGRGNRQPPPSNRVEISVSRLRKSLEEHGPPLIHTLRRRGYILRQPAL